MSTAKDLHEVIADFCFNLGNLWNTLPRTTTEKIEAYFPDGSRSLMNWACEEAIKFQQLWDEGRVNRDDYIGEIDKFFTERFAALANDAGVTLDGRLYLSDGDYELQDNAGWFRVKNVSIRIYEDRGSPTSVVAVMLPDGHEDDQPLDQCSVTFIEAQEAIDALDAELGPPELTDEQREAALEAAAEADPE